ncbi:hypothetical protein [Lichenibacterium ramalinae]|uniref:hypothetical protein n=1 Tax=Lichenibacterium ramalinae TaxID=2316527 RepID=UPI001FDEB57C|nr:hypothetical protein [Lichenibacterium ramalinae]
MATSFIPISCSARPRARSAIPRAGAWTQVASDVLAQNCFRKAGMPARLERVEENDAPRSCGTPCSTSPLSPSWRRRTPRNGSTEAFSEPLGGSR